jgi:hypothetical protein
MVAAKTKIAIALGTVCMVIGIGVFFRSSPNPSAWVEAADADVGEEDFVITTPSDFRVCAPPKDVSVSNGIVIPVDRLTSCRDFLQNIDSATWPSHLNVGRDFDSAESFDTTADLARQYDTCFEMPGAVFFSKDQDTSLDKIDTITCTLAYKDGRYEKLALAYWSPGDSGPRTNYYVRLSAKIDQRERADRLFRDVVASFRRTY